MLTLRGRDWQAFHNPKRARLVERAFRFWRKTGFPHYALGPKEILREYTNLFHQPISALNPAGVGGSNTALRLANFFQPHMWSVRVSRYLSPDDVFQSDELLPAAIRRSWSIWPDRFGANPATLRRILKTFPNVASVSNFRPTVSRTIINHFSRDDGTVLDFSAGYGGRLLGALSLRRNYIGIEPCPAQVQGLNAMLQRLSENGVAGAGEILPGCAEDVMPSLPAAWVDLVFSSPPYFNWEKYSHDESQSFIRFASYADWKQGFLEPVIRHSHRVLRAKGKFVVNVSTERRLPSIPEVKAIASQVGFRYLHTIPLLIARVPYLHPRGDRPHKQEALLAFEKR
jgi:SAM-dependent methyltransferase